MLLATLRLLGYLKCSLQIANITPYRTIVLLWSSVTIPLALVRVYHTVDQQRN